MKTHDLRKKTEQELHEVLSENRKKLMELRFHAVQGKVKNVSEIGNIRKMNARIHTLLKEKKEKLSS